MQRSLSIIALCLLLAGCRAIAGYAPAEQRDLGPTPSDASDAASDSSGEGPNPVNDSKPADLRTTCPPWSSGPCPEPRQLALGVEFSCLLTAVGQVYCWGDNSGGQLGRVGPDEPTPQLVVGVTLRPGTRGGAKRTFAAGAAHVCGIDPNGQLLCWGYNEQGQVAAGTTSPTVLGPTTLAPLPNSQRAISVAAGYRHSCALTNAGRVYCWGEEVLGQLGSPGATGRVEVSLPTGTTATALSCGLNHCCAALDTNEVACWGQNAQLQLNKGTPGTTSAMPVASQPVSAPLRQLACGGDFCCALGGPGNGELACWGDNSVAQLGTGASGAPRLATPATAIALSEPVTSLRLGGAHACVRHTSGRATCWGYGAYGQTLAAVTQPSGEGSALPGSDYLELALGLYHSCAIHTGGVVDCWGKNRAGQLGDGSMDRRAAPAPTQRPTAIQGKPKQLVAGGYHSCLITSDDKLACWGYNQLTQSAATPSWTVPSPTIFVVSNTAVTADLLALGGVHGCYRDKNKAKLGLFCFGGSRSGQTGAVSDLTPPQLVELPDAVGVAAGKKHSCALDSAKVAVCWGENVRGQLGTPKPTGSTTPVSVPGLTNGNKQIVARNYASCVITAAATLRCWGDVEAPQVGVPLGPTPLVSPLADQKVSAVTLGGRHACALLKSADSVKCWGDATDGRLGAAAGSAVTGIGKPTAISAGLGFTCARNDKGEVYCWGANVHYELASEAVRASAMPLRVPLPQSATAIAAGWNHACAQLDDGTVHCWGDTAFGALGDGTPPNRTPRIILMP
jgi:alpha-tubulin suppressor-like RCC1 family protein